MKTFMIIYISLALKVWYEKEKKKSIGPLLYELDKHQHEGLRKENEKIKRWVTKHGVDVNVV